MNMFLTLAYLFFIGSTLGWVAELLYRRFLSGANPERKWINPGFCVGPYVPLYGSGLCILYLLASLGERNGVDTVGEKLLLFAGMALSMTVIEYVAGIVSLKFMKIRLWDYSKQWGNIQGLICPAFSALWAAVSAVYYFCVHPYILDALDWLSRNLAFSFVIGYFFGVFTIDLVYAAKLLKDRGYSNFRILVAGTGAFEEEVPRAVTEMGVEDVVQMLGFRSDAAALLNILDVQLNASYGTEATSMALLEGMSLGLPTIASDYGGNPFVITSGQNGLLFPSKDSAALADAMAELMDHPEEVAIMREKALETYQSRFTGEVFARNTEQIYENVLKGASK